MEKAYEEINGFKIIHTTPDLTEGEKEEIQKKILERIYNNLFNRQ